MNSYFNKQKKKQITFSPVVENQLEQDEQWFKPSQEQDSMILRAIKLMSTKLLDLLKVLIALG